MELFGLLFVFLDLGGVVVEVDAVFEGFEQVDESRVGLASGGDALQFGRGF